MKTDMRVEFCGLELKNPLIAASADYSREKDSFTRLAKSGVAAIILKSVTDAEALQAKSIARFDIMDVKQNKVRGDIPEQYTFFSRGGSMLKLSEFTETAKEYLEIAKENDVLLIGSIAASKKENWVTYAKHMEKMGMQAIELNFGNPHGEASDGKLGFLIGQIPELCCDITKAVLDAVDIPVIAKLTPQISDMAELASALKKVGVRAVTAMHRFQGLVVDPIDEEVFLGGYAAIGGTWMKPVSLANIAKVYRQTGMEICGSNGVDTGKDLVEYMMCGAKVVQMCSTLMFKGVDSAAKIICDAQEIMTKKEVAKAEDIVGRLAKKIITYKNLGDLPNIKSEVDTTKCEKCKDKPCLSRCYFSAIRLENGKVVADDEACTGCGMCIHICTENAVKLVEY
ncbi:tRNA-dihydrouridine synthase [Anaerotignum sp.]|uniref:tRNA-dihydrouridine synthase n=1 Tax=Anaerotignum sp. TaxID=2039241 RepID=UPI002714D56A|nr:tRNA-dihydrouridine synthase [Anaerotignum sp.]